MSSFRRQVTFEDEKKVIDAYENLSRVELFDSFSDNTTEDIPDEIVQLEFQMVINTVDDDDDDILENRVDESTASSFGETGPSFIQLKTLARLRGCTAVMAMSEMQLVDYLNIRCSGKNGKPLWSDIYTKRVFKF